MDKYTALFNQSLVGPKINIYSNCSKIYNMQHKYAIGLLVYGQHITTSEREPDSVRYSVHHMLASSCSSAATNWPNTSADFSSVYFFAKKLFSDVSQCYWQWNNQNCPQTYALFFTVSILYFHKTTITVSSKLWRLGLWFFSGRTSTPYNRSGIHLALINWTVTSSVFGSYT